MLGNFWQMVYNHHSKTSYIVFPCLNWANISMEHFILNEHVGSYFLLNVCHQVKFYFQKLMEHVSAAALEK